MFVGFNMTFSWTCSAGTVPRRAADYPASTTSPR
jgi:hypothetical protein